jgi:3,4-dihydroxy 2-butanone 4-phosphate synthase / GTP cyclohydrolase II
VTVGRGRRRLSTIDEALAAIRAGGFVVVVDDEDREDEGDLIAAAEHMTDAKMAFLLRHSSGIICAAMSDARARELELPPMSASNTDSHQTAFTVSVDHVATTTGISAADRALTIRALADPATPPSRLSRPGHVFPLRARDGGVLERDGHTEASVDLCRLAGVEPVGVLSEIVHDDGTVARLPALEVFARHHGLPLISVAQLAEHRTRSERLVEEVARARVPTDHGPFDVVVFRSAIDGSEHVALVRGELAGAVPPLVRVHSECLTGDVLGSRRCDCGAQLELSLEEISAAGRGAVIYLRGHEGRGIGLANKLRAYVLQDQGLDTVDANLEQGLPVDARDYGVGAQMLRALGISRLRLLSNNPSKSSGLQRYGIEVSEHVPLLSVAAPESRRYLEAKQRRLGHHLSLDTHQVLRFRGGDVGGEMLVPDAPPGWI